jgi:hypothetical protein
MSKGHPPCLRVIEYLQWASNMSKGHRTTTLCNKPSVHKVWSLILITYLLNIAQSAKHMSETSRSVKYVSDISTHVVFSESKQQCYNSAGRALGSRVKGGGWGTEGYWGIGGSYIFIYIHINIYIYVYIYSVYIYIFRGEGDPY